MKKFSVHVTRNMFAVAIVIGVGYIAYLTNPISIGTPKVEAGTTENVSGWIWANTPQSTGSPSAGTNQGVGWISLNNTTDGSPVSYGVNVGTTNKAAGGINTFSGRGWGENIGWISFTSTDTASCGSPSARIDWSTGKVSGWAKAMNGTVGGWDGCISLSSASPPPPPGVVYGVVLGDNNKFSGWAWGSDAVGWIDFGPKVNGIDVGAEIAGGSCSTTLVDSAGSWGTCTATATCATLGEGTHTNLSGVKVGQCNETDGGGTTFTTCSTAALVCPAATPSPGTPGKKKFWQF